MALLRLLDKRLWLVPISGGVAVAAIFWILQLNGIAVPLSRIKPDLRGAFYSSIAGTCGGLLGLTLAAVSILVSFKRSTKDDINRARRNISFALLVTGLLLLITLVVSTISIVAPPRGTLDLLAAGGLAGVVLGLLSVGAAFTLAIAARD